MKEHDIVRLLTGLLKGTTGTIISVNVGNGTEEKPEAYTVELQNELQIEPMIVTLLADQVEPVENTFIKIWAFDDAPEQYRKMSQNGGDEDWVAVVPKAYIGMYISWFENYTTDPEKYELPNGDIVYILSHA